jgi:hypothetical protein
VYNPAKSPQNLLIWNQFVHIDSDGGPKLLEQYLKKYQVTNATEIITKVSNQMNPNPDKAKECLRDLLSRQSSSITSQAIDKMVSQLQTRTAGWTPFGMSGYMISNLLVPYLLHMAVRGTVKKTYMDELGIQLKDVQNMIANDPRAAHEFESQLNQRVNEYLRQTKPTKDITVTDVDELVKQVGKMFKDVADQYSSSRVPMNEQGGDFYSFVVREYKLWLTHTAYYMGWVLPYNEIQTPQSLYLAV